MIYYSVSYSNSEAIGKVFTPMSDAVAPFFSAQRNCIVFAMDDMNCSLAAIAISSLIENSNAVNLYDIVVLHSGLSFFYRDRLALLSAGRENVSIRFADISDYAERIAPHRNDFAANYGLLFIPWVLDESYDRALYFDSSIMIRKDVAPLFEYNLQGNVIAGTRDVSGISACYAGREDLADYRKSIGVCEPDNYISSAVLLVVLPQYRNDHAIETVIDTVKSRKWWQHGQDVINVLLKRSITWLDITWNWNSSSDFFEELPEWLYEAHSQSTSDPAVVNFAAKDKPYSQCFLPFADEFWAVAAKTSFFMELFLKIKNPSYKSSLVKQLNQNDIFKPFLSCIPGETGIQSGPCCVTAMKLTAENLSISGFFGVYAADEMEDVKIFLMVNGMLLTPARFTERIGKCPSGEKSPWKGGSFIFSIPLNMAVDYYSLCFFIQFRGTLLPVDKIEFLQLSPLNTRYRYENAYYAAAGWLVKSPDHICLEIYRASVIKKIKAEIKFVMEQFRQNHFAALGGIGLRLFSMVRKKFKRKPILLISDRKDVADDCGEAFFAYLRKERRSDVDAYFVISEKCRSFEQLKREFGHIIAYGSQKHKAMALIADAMISAQTDTEFRKPEDKYQIYSDLYSAIPFIFLQHGVIKDDLSDWLQNTKQNFSGFITTANPEYDSIANGNYDYSAKEIWLTGLSRFDRLYDDRQKIITFMLTWRKYLAIRQNQKNGFWDLIPDFKSSDYCRFYRDLANHPLLKKNAEKYGYQLQFKVHPSFLPHIEKFGFGEHIKLLQEDVSYREIYAQSALCVTDYSSAVFDFAYLRKPVLYTQFDRERFFADHGYSVGYFDYERDGFGEVEYDLESTVNRIIEYIKDDCKLKEKYRQRIEGFFAFNDRNNCQRIYEKICEFLKNQG